MDSCKEVNIIELTANTPWNCEKETPLTPTHAWIYISCTSCTSPAVSKKRRNVIHTYSMMGIWQCLQNHRAAVVWCRSNKRKLVGLGPLIRDRSWIPSVSLLKSERSTLDEQRAAIWSVWRCASLKFIHGAHWNSSNTKGLSPLLDAPSSEWSTACYADGKTRRPCKALSGMIHPGKHHLYYGGTEPALVFRLCLIPDQRWVFRFMLALPPVCTLATTLGLAPNPSLNCSIAILLYPTFIYRRLVIDKSHRAEMADIQVFAVFWVYTPLQSIPSIRAEKES